MRATLRALAAGLLLSALVAGCTDATKQASAGGTGAGGPAGGQPGATVTLTTGSCWTGALAGADPQYVLRLSKKYQVSYFAAAHALATWPSFALTQGCAGEHDVEVYKAVATSNVAPVVTTYAGLLRAGTPAFTRLSLDAEHACMNQVLVDAAAQTGIRSALMSPAFPDSMTLGWAPVSEQQWSKGQRAYACTLTQKPAGRVLYASVFTKAFPTQDRTCIDNATLDYVDCARKHDRERIAWIDLRTAVGAGRVPGHRAIRSGTRGKYVNLKPALYAALDRACTTYLHSVSTTTRLTGVAEIDTDQWPTSDGHYLVACEADAPPTKKSVVTQGSVFDR
ncbi:MAG: hypothetical protein ACJ72E_12800 [Marmoricola sp.]